MDIVLFLLFGLVIGALARLIMPGTEPGGWGVSMVIGLVGSLLGGYLGRVLGMYHQGEPAGFLMSIAGAIILLIGYRALTRNRTLHT